MDSDHAAAVSAGRSVEREASGHSNRAPKRAYVSARKGESLDLPPRSLSIPEFELTRCEFPLIHFRVVCSKGTYIRALARDIGQDLGAGAYLHALCRTRIGNYLLKDAYSIEDVITHYQLKKEAISSAIFFASMAAAAAKSFWVEA